MSASKRTPLTEQQSAAIDTRDVSIALSAGAGCGKTFVLTQRFLSHLDPERDAAPLSQLVAITFTDRAAREMRDRIRSACRERLQNCQPEHVPHWLRVLYDLDSARITTIHSFCASLLRSHAVDAGLDPRFILNDAAQTEAFVQRSARKTLHRLLEQQIDDAMTLVLYFGLERSRDILADAIGQRFRANVDLSQVSRSKIATMWQQLWRDKIQPRFLQEFTESHICTETLHWLKGHSPKPKSVLFGRCRSVRALLENKPTPPADAAAWLAELREAAMVQGGGGKSAWDNSEDNDELKDLWQSLRDEIDRCVNRTAFAADQVDFAAELTERTSRLAANAIADYEQQKQQQGALDFDDLLLKTRDLLHDRPEVAQRLEQGLRQLMVDEFQDTDPVQADIIRTIAGPALKTGKLFIVGDAQQSIYRFRRANPQVFRDLRLEIPERGQLPLLTNFRSVPEILDLVNHLFRKTFGDEFQQLKESESHQVPESQRKAISPVIEFLWATMDVQPAPNPPARPSVEELRKREADWIALRIAELLDDQTPRIREAGPDGKPALRPVKKGDIAILFRTLSDVSGYEDALAKRDIDYYLVGGKTFYAQQEVFDLMNLCQWLDDPADEIPLVGCLRSPFFNLSDDAIYALKLSAATLTQALEQPPPEGISEDDRQRIRFAGKVLSDLRQLKDRLPPSELLRTAVERTGYDAALLHEYLGERKVANLDKLIRQAAEFDDAEQFLLSDYLRQLKRSVQDQTEESLAVTLEEAGDVVRLMTIHQSKGLEFPVVFVADMNREGHPRSFGAVMHPDWGVLIKPPEEFGEKREHLGLRIHHCQEDDEEAKEILRLFYVAATRAADRLILSAGMTPDLKAKSPWMRLLEQYFHLQTGLPKTDPILGSHLGAGADRQRIPDILVHHDPPQVVLKKERTERLVRLAELEDLLSAAEAEEFPESVQVFSPSQDWWGTISVSRLEELATNQRATRDVDSDDDLDQRQVAADVLGNIVHRVLERLDVRQLASWQTVLTDCLRSEPLTPAELSAVRQQVGEMIERWVTSPLAAQLAAAANLHREIDFVLSWPPDAAKPQAMISGQIDVLLRAPAGGWQLLDYKTGLFQASVSDEELLAPYAVQLGIYAMAAERYLNQPLTSVGIVALRPDVRLLRWDWTDRRRSEVMRLVEAALSKPEPALP